MIFTRKLLIIGMILLISLAVLVGCNDNKPEIKTVVTLSNITEEEYQQTQDSRKPGGAAIKDFKKLYVNVKILNSKKAENRTIIIPDLYTIVNVQDRVRAVAGGGADQNNIGTGSIAESIAFVIIDSRGLTEENIRSLYNNSEIKVSYKLKNSDTVENIISIGKNIVINN